MPQTEAKNKIGASQVLYCTPDPVTKRKRLTEVGSMNIFLVWANPTTGKPELVTPPLAHQDILPGVTRQSILDLARSYGGDLCTVSDTTDIFLDDVQKAADESRLLEVFGSGTAAVIAPIKSIFLAADDDEKKNTNIQELAVPVDDATGLGPIASKLLNDLTAAHYGRSPLSADWCVDVNSKDY
mmetsp:Transcript_20111/g.64774  ORF Transcript_20111/g.64774 Transcript_20111/m.64774 type:complete len:184 (+) Transcript_20111:703-1254(+)